MMLSFKSSFQNFQSQKFLDSQNISSYREFLGQAWMKSGKKFRAEHIIQMTKRFNDGSRLVGSEIVSRYYFLQISFSSIPFLFISLVIM